MDDQRFDDIINRKLKNYEAPGFDPASLASLRHQMAAASNSSWHNIYRHEIITVVAIVFSTLLILGIQNYWYKKHYADLLEEIKAATNTSRHETDLGYGDRHDIIHSDRDTIRIIEYRFGRSEDYQLLLLRFTALEHEIQQLRSQLGLSLDNNKIGVFDSSLSFERSNRFSGNGEIAYRRSKRIIPRTEHKSLSSFRPSRKLENTGERRLSQKMMREIERHYQKGVGIKLGPVIETSIGIYSAGTGQFNIGYGVLTEMILSPSLSIETGAKYSKRYYEIGNNKQELYGSALPGVDESSGELQKAEIDNSILEVPLNVKYKLPASLRTYWIGGIGYSPHLYMTQVFEYDYEFDDGSGPSGFVTHSAHHNKSVKVYPGTLNFYIGLNRELKNRKSIETSIIYQHGLTPMGIEKNKTSFLGLKGTYWFTLR